MNLSLPNHPKMEKNTLILSTLTALSSMALIALFSWLFVSVSSHGQRLTELKTASGMNEFRLDQIEKNRESIEAIRSTVIENKTAIAAVGSTVIENKTAIAAVGSTVIENKTAIAAVGSTVIENKTAIAAVSSTVIENKTAIAALNTRIDTLDVRINTLDTRLSNLETDLNTRFNATDAQNAKILKLLEEIGGRQGLHSEQNQLSYLPQGNNRQSPGL